MGKSRSLGLHSDKYPLSLRLEDLSVSRLKLANGSQSTDCLDLASGAPLYRAPEHLKEAAIEAISQDQNQYGNTFGDLVLRDNIANSYSTVYDKEFDGESQITVTNGTSSALAATLLAILNPGDEVIVFEPFYESYIQAIKMAGAIPVFVGLKSKDWSIRIDQLEDAFSKKTKAVILNTPHNPTGCIPTAHAVAYIMELCEEYGAVMISDEIYSKLLLGKNKHQSPLALEELDPNRVIVIDGMSKAYSVSGWRIGYVLASSHYTNAIRLVHSALGLQAPTPLQIAARTAFVEDTSYTVDSQNQSNLSILLDAIASAGFIAVRPKGANFIFADASRLLSDGENARDVLLAKTGILTISGTSFFAKPDKHGRKYIRFCFAKDEATILEAASRLETL